MASIRQENERGKDKKCILAPDPLKYLIMTSGG